MANQLNELSTTNTAPAGVETRVIVKKIPAQVGSGTKLFEALLWFPFVIPGLCYQFAKVQAKEYFQQLEQTIQHNASTIDNYMEQRVVVLQNCARLLDRAADLDRTVFQNLADSRRGAALTDEARNALGENLAAASRSIHMVAEAYPEIHAHQEFQEAMRQNLYLQREITAARELYNDSIAAWNKAIFEWPARVSVAAQEGYTTRIPFAAPEEIRQKSREVFF